MKIWQRIFVVTMFIMTVFTLVMGLLLIGNQYKYQINNEIKNSKQFHEKVLTTVNVEVQKKMQEEKKSFLDDDEFLLAYESAYSKFSDLNYGIKISVDNKNKLQNYNFEDNIIAENTLQNVDEAKYEIIHKGEYYSLIMASHNSIYGRNIKCVTEIDITDVFSAYATQLERLELLSVVLALLAAIILLVVIKLLLCPLKKLQRGIHDIADGNYGRQLEIKGRTEISELTDDVNQMSVRIEQDNQAKENMIYDRQIFINNMAHEMKTPLTAILGFSDILTINPNLTQEQTKEYSGYIYKEALRLKVMSGKLMQLAQLGENNVVHECIDIGEVLKEVIQSEQTILRTNNITIHDKMIHGNVMADKDLMKSLFYNILDNAGKATNAGGYIDVLMKKDIKNIQICVTDYGVGIPKDEVIKVMEPFYMVDKSRTRKDGGAGLGLALCKKIIEISDGTINIDSDIGKGCTVSINLPLVDK